MPVETTAVVADASVPVLVVQALGRCDQAYGAALRMPYGSYVEQALRADALAEACRVRAAWWRVLLRWMFTDDCPLPWIFSAAVLHTCKRDESAARFWREVASDRHADHAARVLDGQPVSGSPR